MLTSYFKTTLRSFRKHKVYAVINFAGLTVGLACCLLIWLYVAHELSFDRHHPEAERSCRLFGAFRPGGFCRFTAPQGNRDPKSDGSFRPRYRGLVLTRFRPTSVDRQCVRLARGLVGRQTLAAGIRIPYPPERGDLCDGVGRLSVYRSAGRGMAFPPQRFLLTSRGNPL